MTRVLLIKKKKKKKKNEKILFDKQSTARDA